MWTCVGVLLAVAARALAITRDQFYPFGVGLDLQLPVGEEVSSPEVTLAVPIRFYGETYETIFVNNFGVLSFRADIPTFMNTEFPLPYPSIAAFYTNVDTTHSGTVYYREANDTHVLVKAEESVQNNFHDFYDFKPTSVFITTWFEVTYKSQFGTDRKNTFQVAVISNGTESFAEFLYPEREIQWIQKETLPNTLPDAKAQAGFSAEDGRLYSLRHSGSHQIKNIVTWSNVNEPGKYVFRIGDIAPGGNIVLPDHYNQNEIEIEEESKTCAQSGPSICHTQASCADYQEGICCHCKEGYYGNGKSCIKNDVPLRVHGSLNGILNNIALNDVDLQAYVVVADGRAYTALTQGPVTLGGSFQLLNVIGSVIGWLFAKPIGNAQNGYQLTGSFFNHSADIVFTTTGDRVTITQEYLGHNVFDQINVKSYIQGRVPEIKISDKLELSEYNEQLTFVNPESIRSESIRTITNKFTGERYELKISQAFNYKTCRFAPTSEEDVRPLVLQVGKNSLGYEIKDNIVRYASSNKIVPLGQEDPCIQGKLTCGPYSSCVVQGSSFACICQHGFTDIYHNNIKTCIDVNECVAGIHNCDINAECYNYDGGFRCQCNPGYEGDGQRCEKISQCRNLRCDPNANCIDNLGGESICLCKPGFSGDGRQCWKTSETSCDIVNNCSPLADCVYSYAINTYVCQCKPGYNGNGYVCEEENNVTQSTVNESDYSQRPSETTCDIVNNCSPQADCSYSYSYDTYVCQCKPGYKGNGYVCEEEHNVTQTTVNESDYSQRPSETTCDIFNNCSPQAECDYSYAINTYVCQCKPGYKGNGYVCEEEHNVTQTIVNESDYNNTYELLHCDENGCSCSEGYTYFNENGYSLCKINDESYNVPDPNGSAMTCHDNLDCPPNAECTPSSSSYSRECVCWEGYQFTGYDCIRSTESHCSCGSAAHCINTALGEQCVCDSGYHGDGYTCRSNIPCSNNTDCEFNAECRPDSQTGQYICQCSDGYSRDHSDACIPAVPLCNEAVCVEHASCLYDSTEDVHYCHCDDGYEGNGITKCEPQGRSCLESYECDPHATCVRSAYSSECVCNEGYLGDGYVCTFERNCRNDISLCNTHASCQKRGEGYICECNTGYFGNGTSCQPNPRLAGNFLVASDGVFIYRVPFQLSGHEMATPINSAIDQIVVGIDVDCQTGKVYWGDVGSYAIKRSAYDGTDFEIFLSQDVGTPEGLSIDWAARNIFWTDATKLTVEVANLETKTRKVLFSKHIKNPRGIAVHPQRGKLFWSDWERENPRIEWSNMDGTERQVFLSMPDVKVPNSLAMDWTTDRLCYADAGLRSIECVNIDTRQRETIAADCPYPFGIAIHDEKFYWTDWKTLKIEYIDSRTHLKGQVPIATASRRLFGVATALDQCYGSSNICEHRNGNCGYNELCLPDGRGGRTCAPADPALLI